MLLCRQPYALETMFQNWPDEDAASGALSVFDWIFNQHDCDFQKWYCSVDATRGRSRLTSRGLPLEWCFASHDSSLRYATEVIDPGQAKTKAITRALTLCRQFGQGVGDDQFKPLIDLQANQNLAFGAWLGGRHQGNKAHFKVYAEIPQNASGSEIASKLWPVINEAYPVLFGALPGFAGREIYYHLKENSRACLLESLSSLPGEAENLYNPLMAAFSRIVDQQNPNIFPASDVGLGVSLNGEGGVENITLYHFADDLWKSDQKAYQALVPILENTGLADAAHQYAQCAQTIGIKPDASPMYHDTVGVCAGNDGKISYYVCLAPPES